MAGEQRRGYGLDAGYSGPVYGFFFATTDQSNAQIASFYPGAMGVAAQQSLHDLKDRPNLVVVSPNSPEAMTKFAAECRELSIPYLYDPSQQILRLEGSGTDPRHGMAPISCLSMITNSN